MGDTSGIELLSACLALSPSPGDTIRLRSALFSDGTAWERLFEAASGLRMMPVLAERLRARGLVPPQIKQHDPRRSTPASVLDAWWADHLAVRARQGESL